MADAGNFEETDLVGCPYDSFEGANLVLCEANLCEWIAQPAAAWSNVGFLIAASLIWRWSREDETPARFLAPIAVLTAIGSFAFHASGTLVGQLVDQSLMFFETALFITIGSVRLRAKPSSLRRLLTYPAIVGLSIAFLVGEPRSGIGLLVLHGCIVVFLEVQTWWRYRGYRVRNALAAIATLVVAFTLWSLDASRTLCDPNNHVFTAHAAYHLLGALSFLFWYRHFAQPDPR